MIVEPGASYRRQLQVAEQDGGRFQDSSLAVIERHVEAKAGSPFTAVRR